MVFAHTSDLLSEVFGKPIVGAQLIDRCAKTIAWSDPGALLRAAGSAVIDGTSLVVSTVSVWYDE
jgi:hypothetical protein